MRAIGTYVKTAYTPEGDTEITFAIENPSEVEKLAEIKNKRLLIDVDVFREKRSTNANDLLWKCLGIIAKANRSDKWSTYLLMLKRYGKFTYILVKPHAVDAMKKIWRECEELGEVNVNGETAIQLLCYYGSSTYNTKEFSDLLDGVISEMEEMGLSLPPSEEVKALLDEWEKQNRRAGE